MSTSDPASREDLIASIRELERKIESDPKAKAALDDAVKVISDRINADMIEKLLAAHGASSNT